MTHEYTHACTKHLDFVNTDESAFSISAEVVGELAKTISDDVSFSDIASVDRQIFCDLIEEINDTVKGNC